MPAPAVRTAAGRPRHPLAQGSGLVILAGQQGSSPACFFTAPNCLTSLLYPRKTNCFLVPYTVSHLLPLLVLSLCLECPTHLSSSQSHSIFRTDATTFLPRGLPQALRWALPFRWLNILAQILAHYIVLTLCVYNPWAYNRVKRKTKDTGECQP